MQTEEKIIERLSKLSPPNLDNVLDLIDFMLEWPQNWEGTFSEDAGSRSIAKPKCRYKGEELVKRLRESRQRLF